MANRDKAALSRFSAAFVSPSMTSCDSCQLTTVIFRSCFLPAPCTSPVRRHATLNRPPSPPPDRRLIRLGIFSPVPRSLRLARQPPVTCSPNFGCSRRLFFRNPHSDRALCKQRRQKLPSSPPVCISGTCLGLSDTKTTPTAPSKSFAVFLTTNALLMIHSSRLTVRTVESLVLDSREKGPELKTARAWNRSARSRQVTSERRLTVRR
ncbi:hypothetical protein B0H11DRAFT_869096 [Mycena galericulata]|nr:hypothetical protein B0H11DRAFT_869096 [Mycena galericulata]